MSTVNGCRCKGLLMIISLRAERYEMRISDFRAKGVRCIEACITFYAIEIREHTIFAGGLSYEIEKVVPTVMKQIVNNLGYYPAEPCGAYFFLISS